MAEYYLYPIFDAPWGTMYPIFHNSNANIGFARYFRYCLSIFFYPTALKGCRGIVFTHGVRVGGRWEKFVWPVSQKLYLVGTLVRGCMCATSWRDLDLTFDLAAVTLSLKILSGLYLGNRKV